MPRKQRDYKAEYRRRLERGLERGLTPSQARGHPRKGEPLATFAERLPASTPEIEAAIRLMREGAGIGQAAREAGVSEKRLRRFLKLRNLASRKGRVWTIHDPRVRRLPVISQGQVKTIFVQGFKPASEAGRAWQAQGRFTQTNDIGLLAPLTGDGVTDTKGRFHPFETNPNTLHRIAAMEEPVFWEIYAITDN